MGKQENSKLVSLADLVGDFIRYWGFRKIHGEIWTLIYLSEQPLSGAELVKMLKVSKALVSPALRELESEGLILQSPSENSKTKRYVAEEDVVACIRAVLQRREKPMMQRISEKFEKLAAHESKEPGLNPERLEKLGIMIGRGQMALAWLADSDEMWTP